MYVVTEYPDGMFSWVDLATTDAEGAKAFYGGLFGWAFDDRPTDMGTIYSMAQIDGKNVAGVSQHSPDMLVQGIPTFWSSYIKHSDADAAAAKIADAGGTVMMPPMDVMEEGRMLVATDPTGAQFGVWQPRNHIGAQLANYPNTLVWNELQTRDLEAAKAFYGTVFGWTFASDRTGYIMGQFGERSHAGMLQMDESWGDVPPNWTVYFLIEGAVSAAIAKAQELGGTTVVPETPIPGMGEFSVLRDPQGGVFTVMRSDIVDAPPGAPTE